MSLSDILKRGQREARSLAGRAQIPEETEATRTAERNILGRQPAFQEDLFAAETVAPSPVQPTGPQIDTKTTVTRARATPELRAIQAEEADIVERRKAAATEAADIEIGADLERAQLQTDLAQEVEELDLQRERVQSEFDTEVSAGIAKTDELRAELEGMEPRSFWQKSDTQDKILMSLAVILGGIGQGLSGAKVNAAAQAMDKAVDRDLQVQRVALNKKLASINASRAATADKRVQRRDAIATFAAREQAAITHTSRLIEALGSRTKSSSRQAVLQDFLAELEAGQLEKRKEMEERFAGTISTDIVEKTPEPQAQIFESIQDAQAAIGQAELTEAQGKAAQFLIETEPQVKNMESIERNLTKSQWGQMRTALREWQAILNEEEIPLAGDALAVARNRLSLTGRDLFEKLLPGQGANYFRNLFSFANNITRDRTGAAIASGEVYDELIKFGPSPVPSVKDMKSAVDSRRNALKGLRIRSGLPARLFFESTKKKGK